jgi:acyl-CoA thioester hydrolase
MDYRDVLARGLDNQVVKLTLEWQAPARFDDVLCAEVQCDHVGNSSYRLQTSFSLWPDGQAVASAEGIYVMVGTADWKKTSVPADIRSALEAGAAGRQVDHADVTA